MQRKIFSSMLLLSGICTVVVYAAVMVSTRGEGWITGLAAVVVILLLSALISFFAAQGMVKRISSRSDYDELSPLFRQLEEQQSTIRSATTDLQERDISFRLIVESMQEGIILLDGRGVILILNSSAAEVLGRGKDELIGKHIFVGSSDPVFQAAIHAALGGQSSEELIDTGSGAIELAASPIFVEGVVRGAVLLMFDVSEKVASEQMRREFSANVSHELKTPLTSISGYAELIRDGLVKNEDVQRFAGKIYNEAQRLIALIEDIIKLSLLDETSEEIRRTQVELLSLAASTAERLSGKAAHYGVHVDVSGDDSKVYGNTRLIEEMIYNLCDNAIKYNRPGGNAKITVKGTQSGTVLAVSDTGIGIPKEHQSRIFERFYRVDKSHSKETGGTGLGLSIVKHTAAFHNAEISLKSSTEKGTTITIKFPPISDIPQERNNTHE